MKKQSEIQAKYDKTHTRRINLKLNLERDADILQKLDSVDSMQGYIKDLIRADSTTTMSEMIDIIKILKREAIEE